MPFQDTVKHKFTLDLSFSLASVCLVTSVPQVITATCMYVAHMLHCNTSGPYHHLCFLNMHPPFRYLSCLRGFYVAHRSVFLKQNSDHTTFLKSTQFHTPSIKIKKTVFSVLMKPKDTCPCPTFLKTLANIFLFTSSAIIAQTFLLSYK